MTPEGKVKSAIKKVLTARGAYFVMPMGTGYGTAGAPDFVVCVDGVFVGIEAKAGKGQTTALQQANLLAIVRAGGAALVINEHNMDQLKGLLDALPAIQRDRSAASVVYPGA